MRVLATTLTNAQKQALVDLLVLGMYADHRLASAEDDYLQRLLDTFQFSSDYERQGFVDAAFTRASRRSQSPEAIRSYVAQLAANFLSTQEGQIVYDTLEELVTSDGGPTAEERQMLSAVKQAFEL
jgi:uncharacterized tellurite resistance protein B-like protein